MLTDQVELFDKALCKSFYANH